MLTISKTPLRVSFFGGGTDYPDYYGQFPGAVLGTAIDQFIYTIALPMAGFAETRYRITYRVVEAVDNIADIKHNVIRATLQEMRYESPINIAIISDIPGNSGLGSSSSFTVGFIRLVEHLRGRSITKLDLMKAAVHIEHDVLKENVGIQDQTHAAFGGLNLYTFHKSDFAIQPVRMVTDCRDALNASLCLIFTGTQRSASQTLEEQMRNTREKKIHKELDHLLALCREGLSLLEGSKPEAMLRDFGALLSDGWETKRRLSTAISNQRVDDIYSEGMRQGAYGGKLCGAGGGGFFMFMAPPETQIKLKETFGASNFVKIAMSDEGAQIVTR